MLSNKLDMLRYILTTKELKCLHQHGDYNKTCIMFGIFRQMGSQDALTWGIVVILTTISGSFAWWCIDCFSSQRFYLASKVKEECS